MKALLMNRVGDWGLTIGILYIYNIYNNYDYSVISGMGGDIGRIGREWMGSSDNYFIGMGDPVKGYLTAMTIYILIGAIAKSAQIGLHCWLPNAMEAPTPVSALLHAATMVRRSCRGIMRIIL